MFKEPIDLTNPRSTEQANLEYACFKTREELIQLEMNPTTQDEYQKALERFQYYFGLLNAKYPWKDCETKSG